MLSDRPYMRSDYQRERTSVLTWLISAIVAGFVVQLLFGTAWTRSATDVTRALGLTAPGLRAGWVWTLLTYSFLHDPRFLFHVAGNLFFLFLLGRELLPMLGSRRFLGLYGVATIAGGLAWAAVHWNSGSQHMLLGATAAIDALFIVYACFFPNQELNFLLLFLFPVTVRPKYVAGALALFDLASLLFWELPGTPLPYGASIASSAHLAGMLTGFAYYRFVYDSPWFRRHPGDPDIQLPRWLKRTAPLPTVPPATQAPSTPEDLRAEVDRILDKINSKGLSSLTPEERRLLDEARDALSRR